MELACYKTGEGMGSGELLIVPRLIQDVEPVQRAYVRVELAPDVDSRLPVKSVVEAEAESSVGHKRTLLGEEE